MGAVLVLFRARAKPWEKEPPPGGTVVAANTLIRRGLAILGESGWQHLLLRENLAVHNPTA